MPAPKRFYVANTGGAMTAFCCLEHRHRWQIACPRVPITQARDVPGGLNPSCEDCGWCGVVAPANGPRCVHHWDDACPTFSFEATICGQRCVSELVRLTGAPLPDNALTLIADVAMQLFDEGEFPSVNLVVRAWQERDSW